MLDTSELVKTDFKTKDADIGNKIPDDVKGIIKPKFNWIAGIGFWWKIKTNWAIKSALDTVLQNANKDERAIKKLQTFNSSCLLLSAFKICLFSNQHLMLDLKEEKGTEYIIAWKSKVLFKFLTDKTFVPNIKYFQN